MCCVASIAFLLCLPVLLALVLALVVAQWFSHSGLSHTISDLASLIVIDHEQQRPSIASIALSASALDRQSHLDSRTHSPRRFALAEPAASEEEEEDEVDGLGHESSASETEEQVRPKKTEEQSV